PPVRTDDVDALAVGSAVEESAPGRRPGLPVLVVGMGRDHLKARSVGIDDSERAVAVRHEISEGEGNVEGELGAVRRPLRPAAPAADPRDLPAVGPVGTDDPDAPAVVGDLVSAWRPGDVAAGTTDR